MADRLAVNAYGGDVLAGDVGEVEKLVDRLDVETAERDRRAAHLVDFIVSGLAQRKELVLQFGRKSRVVMADEARRAARKVHGDRIDAVKTACPTSDRA